MDLPFDKLGEYGFGLYKCQQGNDGADPYFERNVKGSIDHGIEPFAYCFTYPLPHLDPKDQAARFVDRVYRVKEMIGRPIFLDYEWPPVVPTKPGEKGWKEWGCYPAQLASWQKVNCEEVHRLTGIRPVLYIYDWWFACIRDGAPAYGFPTGGDLSWCADYALWMAWYQKNWPKDGEAPKVPKPFPSWLFWQWDGNGGMRLPNGIDADFCVFNGDMDALRALTVPGSDKGEPTSPIIHNSNEIYEQLLKEAQLYRGE